jgi:hypothetical protein
MQPISQEEIADFVGEHINEFHQKRIEKLKTLKLNRVLKRKNPYLFKAKNVVTAEQLVKGILDAHLSSQEEGIFGEFLEKLAIFVNQKVYNGQKSSAEGIDLEFTEGNTRYIVSIKSGPNWGNSSQIKRLENNFKKAKRILRTNSKQSHIAAVNGCCYGRYGQGGAYDKGHYIKICGQDFWYFISGDEDFYQDIIEPLGHKAKENNDLFDVEYGKVVNKFSMQFMKEFCEEDGTINWDDLVEFSSGSISDYIETH